MSTTATLRAQLAAPGLLTMPCCFDALSARLVAEAGFPITFISGFALAAARYALPDTGLVGYAEMTAAARAIVPAVPIPVLADGDTGYGNPLNVRRTVRAYADAGVACIMLEDQQWPKRCGHTAGKQVVGRDEALARIRAALDERDAGADILIMARTDARHTHGLEEALWRARAFAEMGADITFLEAPTDRDEMARYCAEVPGHKMANMLEDGATPWLSPSQLQALGFKIAAYPLTLLSSAAFAMRAALARLAAGEAVEARLPFTELRRLTGFDAYEEALARYPSGSLD